MGWLAQLIAVFKQPPYPATLLPYPKLRNFILDVMAEGRRKHTINLLFEANLTPIRQQMTALGERVSMTAFIAHALAATVDEDKTMHAYRKGKSKRVIFDDVDLAIMVERDIDGHTMPINAIVRGANRKKALQVNSELQLAKTAELGQTGPLPALEKTFFELPTPLRKLIWFVIRNDPHLFKQVAGTVGVTAMGMHAAGPAVLIPITPMTLTLSIGAVTTRLILDHGVPVEREVLQMNLGADHDLIDGAPLMRFMTRFRQRLESPSP
jgi:pyruvate/2-oxoglutarate dehydrogenase complex dihydrolipoamide acyltransferase (E2) component